MVRYHTLWYLGSISRGWLWLSDTVFGYHDFFPIGKDNTYIFAFQDLDGNHGKNAGSSSHEHH